MSLLDKLLKGIGMKPHQIDAMGDEEREILEKAIPSNFTPEDMAGLVDDEDAMNALDAGDEQGFKSALSRFVKSRSKDDDDDDDEDDEDGEDDDWEGSGDDDEDVSDEDVESAAEDLWGDEGDDTVGDKRTKDGGRTKKPVKKSLADYVDDEFADDEDLEDVVDGNEVMERMLKAFDASQRAREKEVAFGLADVRKSLEEIKEALGQFGRMPAGRALPSKPRKGPLDGDVGPDIEKVQKSVFALQEQGAIDGDDALAILDAAERGGPAWEHWKGILAEAEAEAA